MDIYMTQIYNTNARTLTRSRRPYDIFAYIGKVLDNAILVGLSGLGLHSGTRVLDYGCADQPYRNLLPQGCDYLGADLFGNPLADIAIAVDGKTSVPDASCDAVLSTQVLEHVADPTLYLDECKRVLKPEGKLLLSTHGLMVWHPDPVDRWRWTGEGLRHMVEKSGLRIVQFSGIVGLPATALWLLQYSINGKLPWGLRHLFVIAINGAMSMADRLTSAESKSANALVFILVAERPT